MGSRNFHQAWWHVLEGVIVAVIACRYERQKRHTETPSSSMIQRGINCPSAHWYVVRLMSGTTSYNPTPEKICSFSCDDERKSAY